MGVPFETACWGDAAGVDDVEDGALEAAVEQLGPPVQLPEEYLRDSAGRARAVAAIQPPSLPGRADKSV
jgi:hypothetical protein